MVIPLIFPKLPQSSRPESSGLPILTYKKYFLNWVETSLVEVISADSLDLDSLIDLDEQ